MKGRKSLSGVLLLFIVAFLCRTLYSQNLQAQLGSTEYTPAGILGFAQHLVVQKEYYRARLELQRLQSFFPGFIKPQDFYVANLYLLYNGKQVNTLLEMQYQNKSSEIIRILDSIFKTDAALYLEEYQKAHSLIGSVQDFGYGNAIKQYIVKRKIITNLLLNRIDTAHILLKKNIDIKRSVNSSHYKDLITDAAERYDDMRSPSLAALMGIVPGMGYGYSGRKGTGVLAFMVISVFSTLTYFSFKTNNNSLGIFMGAATTFFYSGSIVGGYLESKKNNENILKSMKDNLEEGMSLRQDRDSLYLQYGVSN